MGWMCSTCLCIQFCPFLCFLCNILSSHPVGWMGAQSVLHSYFYHFVLLVTNYFLWTLNFKQGLWGKCSHPLHWGDSWHQSKERDGTRPSTKTIIVAAAAITINIFCLWWKRRSSSTRCIDSWILPHLIVCENCPGCVSGCCVSGYGSIKLSSQKNLCLKASQSTEKRSTVENGYYDYHLVTKIGYCDYFPNSQLPHCTAVVYHLMRKIWYYDYFPLVPR